MNGDDVRPEWVRHLEEKHGLPIHRIPGTVYACCYNPPIVVHSVSIDYAADLSLEVRAPSPEFFFNVIRESIEDILSKRWLAAMRASRTAGMSSLAQRDRPRSRGAGKPTEQERPAFRWRRT